MAKKLQVLGSFGNGVGVEKDPTVPSWAKQPNKPTYTANEVGALSADTFIPSSEDIVTEVNSALEKAKASGDFKGDKGDDYVLTEADKTEITNAVIKALPKYEGEVSEV